MKRTLTVALSLGALGFSGPAASSPAPTAPGSVFGPLLAPPGMPDPRTMSGIPRVDGTLTAGQITVRCLLGGFDQPAVGVSVALVARSPDGDQTQSFTAVADASGRATFTGLQAFVGGTATATATLGGSPVATQPMPLAPAAGTRVLLVAGATGNAVGTAPAPAASAGSESGASPHEIPPFGEAFPLEGRPAGLIIVGLLDVTSPSEGASTAAERSGINPVAGRQVRLLAVGPTVDGADTPAVEVMVATTDVDGRARFDGVENPEGRQLVAESVIRDGTEPQRSKPFVIGSTGLAVVLADAPLEITAPGAGPSAQPPAPTQQRRGPAPMPPVRRDTSLAFGTVRVVVVNGRDQPVPDQAVTVIRIDAARNRVPTRGTTTSAGFADVEVDARDDSFYFVQVTHDDAPYRSGFFEMPPDAGASVAVRVFPRTEDRSRVQGAVHFEIDELENDKARVLQVFEIAVEGEAAFWPRGGMKLWAADDGHGVKPLPQSGRWLEEVEDAPYAKLARPLEPGAVLELSYAYIIDHDGDVEIDWDSPFPLVGARTAVRSKQDVTEGAAGPPQVVPHDEAVTLVPVTRDAWEPSVCERMLADDAGLACSGALAEGGGERVHFTLNGLVRRPRTYWMIGGVAFAFIGLVGFISLITAPRRGSREVLARRRDALLSALEHVGEDTGRRQALIRALDRIYRQLDAIRETSTPKR